MNEFIRWYENHRVLVYVGGAFFLFGELYGFNKGLKYGAAIAARQAPFARF